MYIFLLQVEECIIPCAEHEIRLNCNYGCWCSRRRRFAMFLDLLWCNLRSIGWNTGNGIETLWSQVCTYHVSISICEHCNGVYWCSKRRRQGFSLSEECDFSHLYLYICMFVYLHVCMFVCLYVCMFVYLYICIFCNAMACADAVGGGGVSPQGRSVNSLTLRSVLIPANTIYTV